MITPDGVLNVPQDAKINTMLNEIKQIQATAELLHNEQEVEAAIDLMAEQINTALFQHNPLLLCVMNGGIVTSGKLLTRLNFPLTIDAINASRYRKCHMSPRSRQCRRHWWCSRGHRPSPCSHNRRCLD